MWSTVVGMPSLDGYRRLAAASARPWVATRPELEGEYSRRALDRALRDGVVRRVAASTYVPEAFAESLVARCLAAYVATGRRGVVGGRAALALWGLDDRPPERVMLVLGRHDHAAGMPAGSFVYRTDHHPEAAVLDGFDVARPAWATAEAMREVPRPRRRGLAISALGQGICDAGELASVIDSHPRLLGVRELRGALAAFHAGAHSALEDTAATHVLVGALGRVVRQHVMVVEGRVFRLDAFDEPSRVAIEFDGFASHGGRARWQADRERDALLAGVGVLTLRFTYSDVTTRPEWCRARIWAAIEARGSRLLAA